MAIDFKEFMKKMEQAGENGASKLNMRSEALQEKPKASRFSMLKKDKKKKAKILIIKEIALPFNPTTGVEDDKFNTLTKWRPPFSATSVMLALKGMASENPNTKDTLMQRAGVTEWDLSNLSTLTKEDKVIMGKYLTPRIFTIPTVNVNIPSIAGSNKYGKNYTVSVERDPITGEYKGEMPVILQAHKFFIEKAYEELTEYNEKVSTGEYKHDDQQQKEHKSGIFAKVPVSDLNPANFVQVIEIPLENNYDYKDPDDLKAATAEFIGDSTCIARLNVALNDAINKFRSGEWGKFDKYVDFYALDMCCPNDTDDAAEIGRRTAFEKETESLESCSFYPTVSEAILDYLDNEKNLEEKVYRSTFVTKYDNAAENRLVIALKDVIDLGDKYVTEKVLQSNADFISFVCGEEGAQELIASEFGLSNRTEGNLDSENAKKASKEFDLAGAMAGDIGTDTLDLDAMMDM